MEKNLNYLQNKIPEMNADLEVLKERFDRHSDRYENLISNILVKIDGINEKSIAQKEQIINLVHKVDKDVDSIKTRLTIITTGITIFINALTYLIKIFLVIK